MSSSVGVSGVSGQPPSPLHHLRRHALAHIGGPSIFSVASGRPRLAAHRSHARHRGPGQRRWTRRRAPRAGAARSQRRRRRERLGERSRHHGLSVVDDHHAVARGGHLGKDVRREDDRVLLARPRITCRISTICAGSSPTVGSSRIRTGIVDERLRQPARAAETLREVPDHARQHVADPARRSHASMRVRICLPSTPLMRATKSR